MNVKNQSVRPLGRDILIEDDLCPDRGGLVVDPHLFEGVLSFEAIGLYITLAGVYLTTKRPIKVKDIPHLPHEKLEPILKKLEEKGWIKINE